MGMGLDGKEDLSGIPSFGSGTVGILPSNLS